MNLLYYIKKLISLILLQFVLLAIPFFSVLYISSEYAYPKLVTTTDYTNLNQPVILENNSFGDLLNELFLVKPFPLNSYILIVILTILVIIFLFFKMIIKN